MEQTVTIPEYVIRLKLSNKRMPKYYAKGTKIPKMYNTNQYTFKEKKYRNGVKTLLFDTETKTFVRSNAGVIDKPRYLTIGGNMLYAGINEHLRMKIVKGIKDNFRPYVKKLAPIIKFPIHINAELYTKPNERNWDIDNLWIYIKSFQDLLIEYQIIPDDSVRYITKAPGFEFYPVAQESERKMVFHLIEDRRSVTSHVMFRNSPVPITTVKGQYASPDPAIYLVAREMESGSSAINRDGIHFSCSCGIGKKKILSDSLGKVLYNVRYWAIQHNTDVVIDSNFGTEYSNYNADQMRMLIVKYLSNEGVKVIIHNA